jgi:hypothetical protein
VRRQPHFAFEVVLPSDLISPESLNSLTRLDAIENVSMASKGPARGARAERTGSAYLQLG